jgi:hypothetical protein
MTEAEWNDCADPASMLDFLHGRTSDRKLRLFAVACCRRILHLMHDPRGRRAVEVGERFADSLATAEERRSAEKDAGRAYGEAWALVPGVQAPLSRDGSGQAIYPSEYQLTALRAGAAGAARCTVEDFSDQTIVTIRKQRKSAHTAVRKAILCLHSAAWATNLTKPGWAEEKKAKRHYCTEELAHQRSLLCDIIGDYFRPAAVAPAWFAWNDGAIPKLAQAIYDARAFERMPQQADALEAAGCSDADILAHCRTPGEHVRGCWVVDLLLRKS